MTDDAFQTSGDGGQARVFRLHISRKDQQLQPACVLNNLSDQAGFLQRRLNPGHGGGGLIAAVGGVLAGWWVCGA